MSEAMLDARHYVRAVTELGEKRPVLTSRAIYNERGMKLLDAGVRVDARMYERLVEHRLTMPVEDSLTSDPAVNGRVLRECAESLLERWPLFAAMGERHKAREVVLASLSSLPLPTPIGFCLTLARESFPDLFEHAVLTALTAGYLAWSPVARRHDVLLACAAGLLHDLGMLYIDPVLMAPEKRLSAEQRRQLYAHPLASAMLVERHHDYPREVVSAILEHHEQLDGSGYPRGLDGEAMSPLGRILSLAEVVTAMHARGAKDSELRLSVVLRMNRHRYDQELAQVLLELLAECPVRASSALAGDPVGELNEVQGLLQGWPAVAAAPGPAAVLARTTERVAEIRRALAGAGASPEQLQWLGGDALEPRLLAELSLIAREAAWQVRTVSRELRRRWRLEPGQAYPEALERWLAEVARVCGPLVRGRVAQGD
jgi:HD superfamily phosphodiesterase